MINTPRLALFQPQDSDPFDQTRFNDNADLLDANPGVATLSTTERDALTGGALWEGRIIYNTTTQSVQKYNGTLWDNMPRFNSVNIPDTQSRTNTAYGTLTTPDQISNVILPTNGLIAVAYQATWQESNNGAARAAVFIGGTQLMAAGASATSPSVNAVIGTGAVNSDYALGSYALGLQTPTGSPGGGYTGDVTTGQLVGATNQAGPMFIFAAAGSYTVSIQFKATSGSVTVKNRKLWVWTLGPF